jgi:hypothetical protein
MPPQSTPASYRSPQTRTLRAKAHSSSQLPHRETGAPCDHGLTASTKVKENGREYPFYQCSRRYMDAAPGAPRTCRNRLPGAPTDVWSAVIAALRASDDLHAAFARLQAAPDKQRQRWQDAITRIATERDRLRSQLRTQ